MLGDTPDVNKNGLQTVAEDEVRVILPPVRIKCCVELELIYMYMISDKEFYTNREKTTTTLTNSFNKLLNLDIQDLYLEIKSKPSLPEFLNGDRKISVSFCQEEERLIQNTKTILNTDSGNIRRLFLFMSVPFYLYKKFPDLCYRYMIIEEYINKLYNIDIQQSEYMRLH